MVALIVFLYIIFGTIAGTLHYIINERGVENPDNEGLWMLVGLFWPISLVSYLTFYIYDKYEKNENT